jgi:hypothetical protein
MHDLELTTVWNVQSYFKLIRMEKTQKRMLATQTTSWRKKMINLSVVDEIVIMRH